MKVSEALELLKTMDQNKEIVVYSPCGPAKITNIFENSTNDVVLDVNDYCEKILECGENCLITDEINL